MIKKVSKKILKTRCEKKVVKLMEELEVIERKISDSKDKRRRKEEDRVIDEIGVKPKAFYRYGKKKSVIRSSVGPFLVDGKLVREENKWLTY